MTVFRRVLGWTLLVAGFALAIPGLLVATVGDMVRA